MAPQRVYSNTNLVTQPRVYNEPLPLVGGTGDTISPPLGRGINRGPQITQSLMQPSPPPNLGAIREAVRELYRLGLRQVSRPKFYKPYLEAIHKENPYPRGYGIPEFFLFFGEDGQSTSEHVVRFTM